MKRLAFTLVATSFVIASAPAAGQVYTDYEQCVIDHCMGNFQGDPVGYERCRRYCATLYPPQFAPELAVRLN
jgi:hypothetical protein